MKIPKKLTGVLMAALALAGSAEAARKPVALLGHPDDTSGLVADVCQPNTIRYERIQGAVPADFDFARYACVYVGRALPKGTDEAAFLAGAKRFVAAGGTLVLSGKAKAIGEKVKAKGEGERRKGTVRCFDESTNSLRYDYAAHRRPLAEADENGVFFQTAEGKKVVALVQAYADVLKANPETDTSAPKSEWAKVPLGEKGTLAANGSFAAKPSFAAAPPKWPDHFVFAGEGVPEPAWIVYDARKWQSSQLAGELKYHLDRMSGTECRLVDSIIIQPPGQRIVELKEDPLLKVGEMKIEPLRDKLLLSGRAAGLSHAVTYLLETLGCRYLWPGKTGKVIPKRKTLVIPAIAIDHVSPFLVREIRVFDPLQAYWRENLARLGIDPKAYKKVYDAASLDDRGNRDFFKWHGVNDGREQLGGAYAWGHYFGDYWQKYGASHPDWFALQPTGSREQVLADRPERPQLCLASEGLAKQCAADHIATFRKHPTIKGLSGSLPDGGYMTQCMCEKCRRMDPPNAPKVKIHVQAPLWTAFDYPSLTDRVMAFCNRVVGEIQKECPGKKLCYDIYSCYSTPPVRVKPHPGLVFISCSGSYNSEKAYRGYLKNVADWCTLGNPLLWRPNALIGFHGAMPQNFARLIFNDLETYKVNGVFGTDFDCMDSQWAVKGLVYYMLSKAHLNIDRLGYDTLLDDYCASAFGPAAKPMRGYFDALEKTLTDRIWAKPASKKGWVNCALSLDLDALGAFFAEARAAAANDAEILARIDFHEEGIRYAAFVRRIACADRAGDGAAKRAAQGDYIRFIRSRRTRPDLAVCPTHLGTTFYEHALDGADFPK